MGPPIVTTPLSNAVAFSAYEFAKRLLCHHSEECFSTKQIVMCGGFAGFADSLLMAPIDLVKIRL